MREIEYEITKTLTEKLINNFENIIIQGLKNKGFEFKNKNELENFIKTRCRKEDYLLKKQAIYFVDDAPFLSHNYEQVIEPMQNNNISANWGYYVFL
jgi:hypothetical protein